MSDAAEPLRVGIDGRVFEGPRTGIGRYVFEICRELDRVLPPQAEVFVYARRHVELPPVSSRWRLRVERNPVAARFPASVWLKTRAPSLIAEDALAAFWGTASLLPSLPASTRSVVTVYDLNYLVVPTTMPFSTWLTHRTYFARDVRRADVVVAISAGTASRLRERLGIATDVIVTPAVSAAFGPLAQGAASEVYERLGLRPPYLLAVGTREPRKNLSMLVDAFASARRAGLPPRVTLVLTGAAGWREGPLARAIRSLPKQSVRLLGYVSDDDLAVLYAGATAFVFPSRYEGYGMPVAEARACGAVIVAADVPELREAGGSDATYVAPTTSCLVAALLASARGDLPRAASPVARDGWRHGANAMAGILVSAPRAATPRAPAREAETTLAPRK